MAHKDVSGDFNPQGPRGPRRHPLLQYRVTGLFQSTRPSRASTRMRCRRSPSSSYFNPQGPRGPRPRLPDWLTGPLYFNPQGPRGPRPTSSINNTGLVTFQSTRPSRASTNNLLSQYYNLFPFQSTRPSRASTVKCLQEIWEAVFQSTRPSRASTSSSSSSSLFFVISIHKALAGLDVMWRL